MAPPTTAPPAAPITAPRSLFVLSVEHPLIARAESVSAATPRETCASCMYNLLGGIRTRPRTLGAKVPEFHRNSVLGRNFAAAENSKQSHHLTIRQLRDPLRRRLFRQSR